jgi:hypothetical protein
MECGFWSPSKFSCRYKYVISFVYCCFIVEQNHKPNLNGILPHD